MVKNNLVKHVKKSENVASVIKRMFEPKQAENVGVRKWPVCMWGEIDAFIKDKKRESIVVLKEIVNI